MFAAQNQQGLTLIELMIGLLIGSIITAGAITVYNNTLKSNTDNLNLARLNQDLRGMMDIMARDIRRAGFVTDQPTDNDGNGDGINDDLTNNPFTDSTTIGATTDLMVIGGDCIQYTYNRDNDTSAGGNNPVDSNEFLGFKLKLENNQLKMRNGGGAPGTTDDCDDGSWQNITEPEVEITGLVFTKSDDNANAYNITSMMTPDPARNDVDGNPCMMGDNSCDIPPSCDAGEACRTCTLDGSPDPACIFTRAVTISLTGRLASDPSVTQTLTDEVRIRNDKYVAALP